VTEICQFGDNQGAGAGQKVCGESGINQMAGGCSASRLCLRMFVMNVLLGMGSVLSLSASELYRYPYRAPYQGFAGDWKRMGDDVAAALEFEDE